MFKKLSFKMRKYLVGPNTEKQKEKGIGLMASVLDQPNPSLKITSKKIDSLLIAFFTK